MIEGLAALCVDVAHVVLDDLGEVAEFLLRTTPADELACTVEGSSQEADTECGAEGDRFLC